MAATLLLLCAAVVTVAAQVIIPVPGHQITDKLIVLKSMLTSLQWQLDGHQTSCCTPVLRLGDWGTYIREHLLEYVDLTDLGDGKSKIDSAEIKHMGTSQPPPPPRKLCISNSIWCSGAKISGDEANIKHLKEHVPGTRSDLKTAKSYGDLGTIESSVNFAPGTMHKSMK
ncbi:hypothetical protein CHS0354_030783 [Potamilus streckersoni]|uniref:Uncharacterized protein n=1 Tax=Potamilus streckersoni TaxID=2493646 RepID=A0AAE0TE64_9BIVA|nr:hypothetical protein CHS0354_030783 [Potamilus streckersoni]